MQCTWVCPLQGSSYVSIHPYILEIMWLIRACRADQICTCALVIEYQHKPVEWKNRSSYHYEHWLLAFTSLSSSSLGSKSANISSGQHQAPSSNLVNPISCANISLLARWVTWNVWREFEGSKISRKYTYLLSLFRAGSHVDMLIVAGCL